MTEYRCRGVRLIAEQNGEPQDVDGFRFEPVEDEFDAESWGVYEIEEDGTDLWVADFHTRELAEEYIQFKSANDVRLIKNEP